jgi:hypothetical protein
MSVSESKGEFLPVRLETDHPPMAMAGCAWLISLFLIGFGGFFIFFDLKYSEKREGAVLVVAGGFAPTGLLVLFGAIQRSLASRTPPTILEMQSLPLERGSSTKCVVIQRGPTELKSLRVNLVCFRTTMRIVRRKNSDVKEYTTQEIFSVNAFQSEPLVITEGDRYTDSFVVEVPKDGLPSGEETRKTTISWKLEAWGAGSFRNRFMHPFEVRVT